MAHSRRAERHRPAALRSPEFKRREADRVRIRAIREAETFWFRLR